MKRLTIDEMRLIAESKGGKCLSHEYFDQKTKLTWKCAKGHVWEATPGSIKAGKWCSYCSGNAKLTLEDMQKLAKSKGGKCLSNEYSGANSKLLWECKEGHAWETQPSSIQQGKWCPICSAGISERVCRKFFEILFKKEFPRARPNWLAGFKRRSLELDGYCRELGLAFEYHGEQHFQENRRFRGQMALAQRKEYDELKRERCRQNNVVLIEIPYTVKYGDMQKYITIKCVEQGFIPIEKRLIDYTQFDDVYAPNSLLLEKQKAIVESKGGKCLSTKYIDSETKLEYECKNGHRFFVRPRHIVAGIWCPRCSNRAKHTLEEMQQLAESKCGKCLSKEYKGVHTKLEWQCKFGHVWKTEPEGVIRGGWCPKCAHDRPAWNKGKKGLQKAWNKGVPMRKESRRKVSESLKGNIPWNKGKKTNQVTWSKGKKGIHLSPKSEFKKGMIPWNKGKTGWGAGANNSFYGRKHTEEAKKKMSEAHNGKIAGMFGKHHSEASKKKISESKKQRTKLLRKTPDKVNRVSDFLHLSTRSLFHLFRAIH